MRKKVRVTKSSGNVFADIGLPDAAAHSIKADIVLRIAARIRSKGLTQAKAASLLGLAQPDVSGAGGSDQHRFACSIAPGGY